MIMRKKIGKLLIPILCLIPLLTGTIGYLNCGEEVTNSLYASFALYFTNPVSDAYNGCIEFARWTAPLVTATAILCVLKTVWENLSLRLHLLGSRDSVAVYTDEDVEIAFDKKTKVIYPGDHFKGYAKSQILWFSTDEKNLEFYAEHRDQLVKKEVYMGLHDLELGCMKEMKNVTLFDINSSISKMLWNRIALWNAGKEHIKVTVYGSGVLAQNILAGGLQLNLFSGEQEVEYHVISGDSAFQIKHPAMPLMNADELHYYGEDDDRIWEVMGTSNLVIVAEKVSAQRLQTIAVRAENAPVYYYAPKEGELAEYLDFDNLIPFGRDSEVLTDENIRRQQLIRRAISLNEHYAEQYGGDPDWNNLSGFLKASNISSADYGEIIASMPPDTSEEMLVRLEHIRWCRFYYLNYWKYGAPEDGKRKDSAKRIHIDLVPFDRLTQVEQEKDLTAIRTWRSKA